MIHSEHGHENGTGGVCAPGDTDGGEEVAQGAVDTDAHADAAEADHG